MSPKVNREEREKSIVEAARALIREDGFVNLKMSDLAKQAEMSVGTLYSHFPSKEDLLLGLHLHNLQSKEVLFERVLSTEKWNKLERLVAMILSDWDIDRKLEELSEIDALAMFPSIWEKASAGITGRLEENSRAMGDLIKGHIQELIAEEGLDMVESDFPPSVKIGVSFWGMGLGLHHVFRSFCMKKVENLSVESEEAIVCESMHMLVKGLGAKTELSRQDIQTILKDIQIITSEVVA